MSLSDDLTREQMRALWERSGLCYEDLMANDIRALEGYLAIECARHEQTPSVCRMEMHPAYRKKYQPQINVAENGYGIESAFLRVSGSYFQGREAVSFNADGRIGFAGWADDRNVQPFLRGFYCWLANWLGFRTRARERIDRAKEVGRFWEKESATNGNR